MPEQTKQRDGARKGAGRPKLEDPTMYYNIRLTKAQIAQLKLLGGSKWVRQKIALATLG